MRKLKSFLIVLFVGVLGELVLAPFRKTPNVKTNMRTQNIYALTALVILQILMFPIAHLLTAAVECWDDIVDAIREYVEFIVARDRARRQR